MPKTVIKLTDEIYRKGEKEKNSAQMLKAYMWRMKYQEIVTPDSFYVGLTGLEQWAETNKTAYGPCYIALIDSGNLC